MGRHFSPLRDTQDDREAAHQPQYCALGGDVSEGESKLERMEACLAHAPVQVLPVTELCDSLSAHNGERRSRFDE